MKLLNRKIFLRFCSKDEENNFNADIVNDHYFKPFEYKSKLLGSKVPGGNIRIIQKTSMVMPIKYSKKFWRSLETPFITYKVKIKIQLVLIRMMLVPIISFYTDKDAKLYVYVVTLSTKDNQILLKPLIV